MRGVSGLSLFWFISLLFLLSTSQVFSEEGFHSVGSLNPSLKRAWDSTFSIYTKEGGGTATLINKEISNGGLKLAFLTAFHVVNDACKNGFGICNGLKVSRSMNNYQVSPSHYLTTGVPILRGAAYLTKASISLDLAIIEIDTTQDDKGDVEKIVPAQVSTECSLKATDRVYLIGFPVVSDRTKENLYYERLKKMWSTGVVTDFRFDDREKSAIYSTADSIQGDSGGPLLNSQGDIVGVLSGTMQGSDWGAKYVGDETPNSLKPHSQANGCDYLNKFLKTSGRNLERPGFAGFN